jgi:AcrR family transcriptional regulator
VSIATAEKYQTVQFRNPGGAGSLAAVSSKAAEMAIAPRRGRPRSPELDAAILDAALRLLTAEGYARMSMDAVAADAGVGKATIYLRYRGKADLATAALARLRESGRPAPTGDLRADLVAQLRQLRTNAERVSAMALVGTCLTEEQHTPELLTLFRERTLRPRRGLLRELLDAGRASGRIDRDADIDAAVDLFMGAYQARYLSGEPFGERWEERAVDALLRGVGG